MARLADLPPPDVDPDAAVERARAILEGDEFDQRRGFVERFWDWLADRIADLFGNLTFSGQVSGVGSLVAWLILLAVAAAIVMLVRSWTWRGRSPRGVPIEVEVSERASTDWRADALRHERAGEWRLAIRARYRELLATLYERQLLEDLAGRTAGEYRRALNQTAPVAAPSFAAATDRFERAWYSDLPSGPEELAGFRADAERTVAATVLASEPVGARR